MRPVAFVTCEKHPNLTPDDRRLIEPMSKAGFRIEPAIWNAPGIDWKNFDSVVLRSPWDYYLKFEKFVHWLKDLEALGVELWNPYEVIHWNTRKSYLREFEKQGIRIPPTEWIEQGSSPDILSIL